MNKGSSLLIIDGMSFLGPAVARKLKILGYNHIICRPNFNPQRQLETERFFARQRPEYIFLLAVNSGGIRQNILHPAEFIYSNLIAQANIIHCAYKYKAKKLLFLASSCVYPKDSPQPIRQDYLLSSRLEPTSEPYAVAKIGGIKLCQAYNRQYKTNFICAVPATLYGPSDHFDEGGHVVADLIRKFHHSSHGSKKSPVKVWGTGRPKREFIFIDDAADACILLMRRYNGREVINIGTSKEVSIRYLAESLREICRLNLPIKYETDKPDGAARKLLDSRKIFALGFRPKVSLREGLELTYRWYAT